MNQIRKVTLANVASAAGVSRTTASYILSKARGGFAAETVERVRKTAKELGFRPNAIARGLRTGRTKLLGFLSVVDLEAAFPALRHQLEFGIALEARKHGMDIVKVLISHDADSEIDRIRDLIETSLVECVVLENTPRGSKLIPSLLEWGARFVVVGTPGIPGVYTVDADNYRLGYAAAKHLVDLGHRRIAFIAPPEHWDWANERVQGFIDACAPCGAQPIIIRGDASTASGYQNVQALVKEKPRITGLWAHDQIAHAAIVAINEAGLSVPDDISILGCNNDPMVRLQADMLSTIDIHFEELGALAARKVLSIVEGEVVAEHDVSEFELLVRKSSGPAKA